MNTFHKSDPWGSDEFIYVDGVPCVYSWRGSEMLVHFPGGVSRSLSALHLADFALTMPKRLRRDRPTADDDAPQAGVAVRRRREAAARYAGNAGAHDWQE